jgi:hypothetical protein
MEDILKLNPSQPRPCSLSISQSSILEGHTNYTKSVTEFYTVQDMMKGIRELS